MIRARIVMGALALGACTPQRDPVEAKGPRTDAGAVEVVVADAGRGVPVLASSSSPYETPDTVLRDAPALAVKWTAPINAHPYPVLVTVGARNIVVALDPKGQVVVARDAKTGAEVWKAAAPPDLTLYELVVGKTHAYGVSMEGEAMAVRLADGGVAWRQKDLYGLATGRDGSGLSVGSKTACGTQLVDPASGRRFAATFPGQVMHYRPLRGEDGNYRDNGHDRCMPNLHLLAQRGGSPIVVVEDPQRRGAKLGAIDTSATTPTFRWSVSFTSEHVFIARLEEDGALVWTEDGADLVVWRVDFGAGKIAWRRTLPHKESCPEPRRQARMVDDILVVQSCNTVMRLDPKGGRPLWTGYGVDAIAPLEGETMPPGDYEAFADTGPRPFVVQWLDRATGEPKGRATLPKSAHDMALAKDGALFLERTKTVLGEMGMIGLDGKERWRRGPALFGYIAVGRFIATGWPRGDHRHDHVLIDPQNGDVVGIAPQTNHVVGAIPERAPELLLASGEGAVTAFVLPTTP